MRAPRAARPGGHGVARPCGFGPPLVSSPPMARSVGPRSARPVARIAFAAALAALGVLLALRARGVEPGTDGAPLRPMDVARSPAATAAPDPAELTSPRQDADAAPRAALAAPEAVARAVAPVTKPPDGLARLALRAESGGRPAPGARVVLRGTGEPVFPSDGPRDAEGRVVTDADGRLVVDVRPMATWLIEVAATDPPREGSFIGTSPRPGESRAIVIALEPTPSARFVRLALVSAPSGAPVVGARIDAVAATGEGRMLDTSAAATSAVGATSGVSDHGGEVTLCWPEGAFLRIVAAGHTSRHLASADAKVPLTSFTYPDAVTAARAAPTVVDLAAHGVVEGTLGPSWGAGWKLYISGHATHEAGGGGWPALTVDPTGGWRVDGLETSLARLPPSTLASRVFGVGPGEVVYDLSLSRVVPKTQGDWLPLACDVVLAPGERRDLSQSFAALYAPLEAAVRAEGVPLPPGTLVSVDLDPAVRGVLPPEPLALTGDAKRFLASRRTFDRELHLTIGPDGFARHPGLPRGTHEMRFQASLGGAAEVHGGWYVTSFVHPATDVSPGGVVELDLTRR